MHSSPCRILVAERPVDAPHTVSTYLRLLGHDVVELQDAAALAFCVEEVRPEILILDLGLAGIEAEPVSTAVAGSSWGRHVHRVALSGWGERVDTRTMRRAGFSMHLVRPVSISRLTEMVLKCRNRKPLAPAVSRAPLRYAAAIKPAAGRHLPLLLSTAQSADN